MRSPTINFRVLLLAVLPTTAVSVIFFSYFVNKQIDDIESNIIDKGESLSRHLASASEYGIFSGNMTILSPSVDSAFSNNDVISITITNNQGTPLIQRTKANKSPSKKITETQNRVFSQPVIQHTIDINDFESYDDKIPPVIGWVVVEMSNDTAVMHKQDAIQQTLIITLLILTSSIFLATRISRHITEPISSLTSAVNEIENGNLDVTISTHSTGPLLTLEKGIRSMLQSIKSSHWEARNTIEKATRELRDSLELLEKQNSELSDARKKALSASNAKSVFLANISHEIRTPMNGILGFVKLLKSTNPTPEQAEYLYTIEQSANNLLRIINDILDFSRIEAGKLPLNNVQFNLEECVEDALALVAPSAHEKGLEITSLFYDDTPKELLGAADRVRQIIINLTSNAIKFSDRGTIMVRVMLESKSDDTQLIKISVTDQGTGISEKDKGLLFKSFSQISGSNEHQFGGTGLGLAISKSLAEAMNGTIGMESLKNEGSTFWFTFECQLADPDNITDEPVHPLYSGRSVRLYDENELTRISLTHTFRHLGFSVSECFDMDELLEPQTTSCPADLFVLNLNQRQASESKVRAFIKDFKKNETVKILVTVSSSNQHQLNEFLNWGADACLSMPFRHVDLEKKLADIFHDPKDTTPSSEQEAQVRLNGMNILIAEDNEINAKLIKTILKRAGARTTFVDNGQEAIDAFCKEKFSVILMDINMPIMNGVDAAREIRKTEDPTERVAIIGLTAASKSKQESLSNNKDFEEVLEKPISVDELLHEIAYWTHTKKVTKKSKQSDSTNALGLDKGLSTTLNEMLLRELPNTKVKLLNAYKSADYSLLRKEIHRLLGGMAYCDFTDLQSLTAQYQSSLASDESDISNGFQEIIAEIDRLIANKNS